jgi:NAD(P)H-nitrite reductase large subunit
MKYVIIGNGIAGIHAAETIRKMDPTGSMAIIAAETFPPYCRPMISMVLEGNLPESRLRIRPSTFYEKNDIKPYIGHRATTIDVKGQSVTTDHGKRIYYEKLLIACGADPRPISAEGIHLKNILFMRTQAHVQQMIEALPVVKHALVLGGGLVGFKAAYGLLRRGVQVTMLIASNHPLTMQVDSIAGKMIRSELESKGLTVKTGLEVMAFNGNGKVKNALLSDGSTQRCDLCVIGKGVEPVKSFIPTDDIQTDWGVTVNPHMETSASNVFAAGDIAETMDIVRKTPWVNAIWPEAVHQGRVAGMNMTGRPVIYRGSLGRNVIRIFDMDIMTAGLVTGEDKKGFEAIQKTDLKHQLYRKIVFEGDKIVGFILVNGIEQGGILTSLIQRQLPVTIRKERLLERSFNFSSLV